MRFFIMVGCMLIAKAIRPSVFEDAAVIYVVMILGLIADLYDMFVKDEK